MFWGYRGQYSRQEKKGRRGAAQGLCTRVLSGIILLPTVGCGDMTEMPTVPPTHSMATSSDGITQTPTSGQTVSEPTATPSPQTHTPTPNWGGLPRCIIDAQGNYVGLCITELMADNEAGHADAEGRYFDWIEIQNQSTQAIDLDGLYLTDDDEDIYKWALPADVLAVGERRIIYAAGDAQLGPNYANFRLSNKGEYLGLYDQGRLLHGLDPFPAMGVDQSYALGSALAPEILIASDFEGLFYQGNGVDEAWAETDYNPPEEWVVLKAGLAKDSRVSGWFVERQDSLVQLTDIVVAQNEAEGAVPFAGFLANPPVLDYLDGSDKGYFEGSSAFPGQSDGGGDNDFWLRARGLVHLEAGVDYTFGVRSDDGFVLRINGDYLSAYVRTRGSNDTLATYQAPYTGEFSLDLLYFERSGTAQLEAFMAEGIHTAFETGDFHLLGSENWPIQSLPVDASDSYYRLDANALRDMIHGEAPLHLRLPFHIHDPTDLAGLTLRLHYDDAFEAYINGQLVAQSHPEISNAIGDRSSSDALTAEIIDLDAAVEHLHVGQNILALRILDGGQDAGRFLAVPELEAKLKAATPAWLLQGAASPGEASEEYGYFGEMPAVELPISSGYFDQSIKLDPQGDGQIWYTLNGDFPDGQRGDLWEGPRDVGGNQLLTLRRFAHGYLPSESTQITVLNAQETTQQDGANYPKTWYTREGTDYAVDASVLAQSDYEASFYATLNDIPSLLLTMPQDHLFDPVTGIYVRSDMHGDSWERPIYMQWIEDGQVEALHAGLRMHGGGSRNPMHPKHSMRLTFRKIYGEGKWQYDLFDESTVDEFDSLVLRGGLNNHWHYGKEAERKRAQYVRDTWLRQTQLDMGHLSARSRPIHVYLNELYWGLYMITERPDASFLSEHLGGEEEDWDALNSGEVLDGDKEAYNTLLELIRQDTRQDDIYAAVQNYLDVDAFIDYFLMNLYAGNLDWDFHNWYGGRRRAEGAGYLFFSWDAERTLESVNSNRLGVYYEKNPSEIFQSLRQNAQFRMRFAERAQMHLGEGGALSPEMTAQRFLRLTDLVYDAVVGESARWGDARTPNLDYTRDDHWLVERERLLTEYFPLRTDILMGQLIEGNLWPGATEITPTPATQTPDPATPTTSTPAAQTPAETAAETQVATRTPTAEVTETQDDSDSDSDSDSDEH